MRMEYFVMEVWNDILRSFYNLFLRLLTFVGIMGPQESLAMNRVRVNIRYNSLNVVLDLNPEWSIAKVKDILSSKVKASPHKLKIIFAGRELDDSIKVEDCDVSQYSIIHVVQTKNKTPETSSSQVLLKESLINLQLSEEEKLAGCSLHRPEKTHFFIYCSSICKDVCPGKLRVRCQICKQGTLTVSKDPTCWDDVLIRGRINGTCLGRDCDGNVAEFYFKCASHTSREEETSVVLYLIKNNFRNVPCLSCTEISSVVLVYPCKDGHVTCLDCFRSYCMSHLNERSFIQDEEFGYTLPCPIGCENSFIKETHHFRIIGDEQYERYQRFGAEECLLQSGGILCPRPGCGAGILPDPDCQRIVCAQYGREGCGFVFCRRCLQGYHLGPCTEEEQITNTCKAEYSNELQGEQSKWEEASKKAIKENTKPCPKCRTPTERDGGCMHMICPRAQCKFHWCWICQTEWNRECMGDHWFG